MAIRTCPICMAKVPAGHVVAYSDGIECPGCKAQLEVSGGSRIVGTTGGVLAGVLVWRLTQGAGGTLDWLLPMVYAFLVFSAIAPLFLMATADLRVKPPVPVAEPASAGHGHAGSHH